MVLRVEPILDACIDLFLEALREAFREALREPHLNICFGTHGPSHVVVNPFDAPTDSQGRKTDGRLLSSGLFQVAGVLPVDSHVSFFLSSLLDFEMGDMCV
jgi:hypothetical protein